MQTYSQRDAECRNRRASRSPGLSENLLCCGRAAELWLGPVALLLLVGGEVVPDRNCVLRDCGLHLYGAHNEWPATGRQKSLPVASPLDESEKRPGGAAAAQPTRRHRWHRRREQHRQPPLPHRRPSSHRLQTAALGVIRQRPRAPPSVRVTISVVSDQTTALRRRGTRFGDVACARAANTNTSAVH